MKRGPGRPRKSIDYETAEKLAALQCTQEEIASFMNLSVDTLMRDARFCGIYKEGINKGRMSLRRHQWKALEDGNPTMLVWLGKQYLGQRDKFDMDVKDERLVARMPAPAKDAEEWVNENAPQVH